jgi:hypothetical protein
VYERLRTEAAAKKVGSAPWLALSVRCLFVLSREEWELTARIQTATTMTMNSPDALTELFSLATSKADKAQAVQTAELMREIGLKCIGFNGVCPPRSPLSRPRLQTS